MEKIKQLGIWMDHSNAITMELENDTIIQNNIVSESTHQEKESTLASRGEKHMHVKDQHQQSSYYKKISDVIRNFQDVIIFGPTEAKYELRNLLKEDHLFKDIKIKVRHFDTLTENQMHAFVKEYFK